MPPMHGVLFYVGSNRKALKSLLILMFLTLCTSGLQAQKTSTFRENYTNGKPKVYGKMKGESKTGNWVFYNEAGTVIRREKWKQGKFVWSVEYNEKHQRTKGVDANGKVIVYKGCNCKN